MSTSPPPIVPPVIDDQTVRSEIIWVFCALFIAFFLVSIYLTVRNIQRWLKKKREAQRLYQIQLDNLHQVRQQPPPRPPPPQTETFHSCVSFLDSDFHSARYTTVIYPSLDSIFVQDV